MTHSIFINQSIFHRWQKPHLNSHTHSFSMKAFCFKITNQQWCFQFAWISAEISSHTNETWPEEVSSLDAFVRESAWFWLHNWDLVVIRKRNWNLSAFSLCALFLLQWKLTFDKELSPSSDKWTTEMLSLVRWDASKQFFYYFSFYNFYCSLRCSVSDQVFGFFL